MSGNVVVLYIGVSGREPCVRLPAGVEGVELRLLTAPPERALEAFEQPEGEPPSVVLFDLGGLDPEQALAYVGLLCRRTGVVLLTLGDVDPGLLLETFALGAAGHLPGSAGPADIGVQILLALERRRLERELDRARHRLRATRESFHRLFDHNPLPSLVLDPGEQRFLAVNPAAAALFGYDREELMALSPRQLWEDPAQLAAQGSEDRSATLVRTAMRHRDGRISYVDVTAADVDHEGRPARLLLLRDGHSHERMRQAIRPAGEVTRPRVLLVDDDDAVRFLVREMLVSAGYEPVSAGSAEEALHQMATGTEPFDVVVTDASLPGLSGAELLGRLRTGDPQPQVLVISGYQSDTLAARGLIGRDVPFLAKPFTADELTAKLQEILQAAHRGQQEQQVRFQADLLDAVGQAVVATDLAGRITYWNRAAESLYGWRQEEVLGRDVTEVTPTEESLGQVVEILDGLRRGERWSGELELRRKDGSAFPALVTDAPVRDRRGRLIGIIGVSSDLTERKAVEEHLRQVQRLEAVGQLAGGVAHDFNNLLTVIGGHCAVVASELPEDSALRQHLRHAQEGVERASKLTSQLLAFSRRQVVDERVLDLRRAVTELEPVLRRLLPSEIDLSLDVARQPLWIRVDAGQLQQVILNLAINARDAIDGGGRISFRLDSREMSEREAEEIPWHVVTGEYARMTVEDTGCGIEPHLLDRIFEPFFTTKPVGAGTGLGLSMVYGIVKRARGHVLVESRPGAGARFEILLPRVDESEAGEPVAAARNGAPLPSNGGHQTVVLVEDDPAVQRLFQHVLERAGYRVLPASRGEEALAAVERPDEDVRLVITDVVMPGMGGAQLMDRLRERHSDVEVVLMSGYPREELPELARDLARAAAAFLQKPISPEELVRTVREVLEPSER